MQTVRSKRAAGFTLVEMLVAAAVGLVIITAAAQLFRTAMSATVYITQRAQLQVDVRAALNMIARDASMAGAGLPTGGLQLPTGTGAVSSSYACNQAAYCYLSSSSYPLANYMYGIIPGYQNGNEGGTHVPATGRAADGATFVYVDYSSPIDLSRFTVTAMTANSLTLSPPADGSQPAVNDAAKGIRVGDLVLVESGTGSAVGELTAMAQANAASSATLTFADHDALNINQSTAASGNLKAIIPLPANLSMVRVFRIFVVSYFLEVPAAGTPRLMRQVNGLNAIPVADNIIDLQFTYDLFNTTTATQSAGVQSPNTGTLPPGYIRKVNIFLMGQSILSNLGKTQAFALTSSISTRGMSFSDRYK